MLLSASRLIHPDRSDSHALWVWPNANIARQPPHNRKKIILLMVAPFLLESAARAR
jgi:hypothetical protein